MGLRASTGYVVVWSYDSDQLPDDNVHVNHLLDAVLLLGSWAKPLRPHEHSCDVSAPNFSGDLRIMHHMVRPAADRALNFETAYAAELSARPRDAP